MTIQAEILSYNKFIKQLTLACAKKALGHAVQIPFLPPGANPHSKYISKLDWERQLDQESWFRLNKCKLEELK